MAHPPYSPRKSLHTKTVLVLPRHFEVVPRVFALRVPRQRRPVGGHQHSLEYSLLPVVWPFRTNGSRNRLQHQSWWWWQCGGVTTFSNRTTTKGEKKRWWSWMSCCCCCSTETGLLYMHSLSVGECELDEQLKNRLNSSVAVGLTQQLLHSTLMTTVACFGEPCNDDSEREAFETGRTHGSEADTLRQHWGGKS